MRKRHAIYAEEIFLCNYGTECGKISKSRLISIAKRDQHGQLLKMTMEGWKIKRG